jgi:hypothetical protein
MFAQREGLRDAYPEYQSTMAFTASSPDDLAVVINEFTDRFCVTLVSSTAYAVFLPAGGITHHALVTFERQSSTD